LKNDDIKHNKKDDSKPKYESLKKDNITNKVDALVKKNERYSPVKQEKEDKVK